MQSFFFTLASLAIAALLFVGMGIPLMRRKVRPNGIYGLRTRATCADEVVWYEANARAGKDFVSLGILVLCLVAAAPFLRGIAHETIVLSITGVMIAGLVAVAVRGIRYANRLLEQRRGDLGAGR
jgi:uncharacterized membrane protein